MKRIGWMMMGVPVVLVLVVMVYYGAWEMGRGDSPAGGGRATLSVDEADRALAELAGAQGAIEWRNEWATQVRKLDLAQGPDMGKILPDLSTYPLVVEGDRSEAHAEICGSTEKTGQAEDGWLNEVAREFNRDAPPLAGGAKPQISIRSIPSGTCYEYIAAGRYRPDGFTPSNVLWIRMLEARGVAMHPIAERLTGNTAGLVLRDEVAQRLDVAGAGDPVQTVIEAVAGGRLAMAYTNPFASSTGLNFLQTTLWSYAQGDESRMLTPEVASAFEAFQGGVPFVALTTLQLATALEGAGQGKGIEAFVMEEQTFARTKSLASGFTFLPFGVAHDNPLYAVGEGRTGTHEVLRRFAEAARSEAAQAQATRYGFNGPQGEDDRQAAPSGETLLEAQKLWKERKDAGEPIVSLFVADVSGSMAGEPLAELRRALESGIEFISPTTRVGLVAFSDRVTVRAPIQPLTLQHKARMLAAVDGLRDGGGTALYDAVAVAAHLVQEAMRKEEGTTRPRIIVLSDGEATTGIRARRIAPIVQALRLPIYTIAYGERSDREALQGLSDLGEAASLKSDPDRVAQRIGSLLNAQL